MVFARCRLPHVGCWRSDPDGTGSTDLAHFLQFHEVDAPKPSRKDRSADDVAFLRSSYRNFSPRSYRFAREFSFDGCTHKRLDSSDPLLEVPAAGPKDAPLAFTYPPSHRLRLDSDECHVSVEMVPLTDQGSEDLPTGTARTDIFLSRGKSECPCCSVDYRI
jgi:hypothetical protein